MYDFLVKVLGYFSNFNTLIQFIFSIIAIYIVVFLIVFRFRSFIYKMLKDYDIGFFTCFRISFKCRRNSKKAIRFFVEYAIFKYTDQKIEKRTKRNIINAFLKGLKGGGSNRKLWKNVSRDFFNNFDLSDEKAYTIELESTFLLDNKEIRDLINKYFELLKQKRYKKRFELSDKAPLSFVSSIAFKSGFLLITTFITGLQKIYRENWQSVIEKYVENYKQYGKEFMDSTEYFSIYNWLTWGPSYEAKFEDNDYKILQYGLFDETNTNCFILGNDEESAKVWQKIKQTKENNQLGFFYSAKCKICETKSFFDNNERYFGTVSKPIIDRIKSPNNEINFLLCFIEGFEKKKSSLPAYLFTSYVWLMLYWKDPDLQTKNKFDLNPSQNSDLSIFNLDNAALFFEDTNVADKENFNFQIDIIVHKTFTHLKNIFNDERFKNRAYYYICSINDYAEQKFLDKYNELINLNDEFAGNLKVRLDIKTKPFTLNTIMTSIENKFCENSFELCHRDIDINNFKDLNLFNTFYKDFMIKYFPDENERETIENLIEQKEKFNEIENKTGDRYHIIVTKSGEDIIGGALACYFEKTNSALLEYIVVDEKFRTKKIGSAIMDNLYCVLERDAKNTGKKCVDYIFIETENPDKAPGNKLEIKKRLIIWKKWHFKNVDLNYIQPALGKGKKDVDHFYLGLRIMNEEIISLKASVLLSFLKDAYFYSMSQSDPESNKNFQIMRDELIIDKEKDRDVNLLEF